MSPRLATALRIVGSLAFFALAFAGIGVDRVLDVLGDADLGWAALALVPLGASYAIGACRWWLLVRGQGIDLPVADAVRWSWIGLFFTNVLPGGFGGDALRAWAVGKRTGRRGAVAASVLVDRLTAVWALVALGLVGLAAAPEPVPDEVLATMALSAAAVLAGSVALFVGWPLPQLGRARRLGVVARAAASVDLAIDAYRGAPRLLAAAAGVSVAGQLCVAAAGWMLGRALHLDLGLLLLMSTVPVVLLATAVPTSINGLGVREAVFRALLVPAGVPAAGAVAFSLANVVAAAVISLPGAVLWVVDRRSRP